MGHSQPIISDGPGNLDTPPDKDLYEIGPNGAYTNKFSKVGVNTLYNSRIYINKLKND